MNIYHFNPTCEYAVNNGSENWQPNKLLQKMEYDLEMLPVYLANSSDFIISNHYPSEKFIARLTQAGLTLPEFICKNDISIYSKHKTIIDKLIPWGWSPAEHKLLKPLKLFCSESFQKSPVYNWQEEHRNLFSRRFAIQILNRLLSRLDLQILISEDDVGVICSTKTEVEKQLLIWDKLMIKAPWSSSGRGLQPISKTPVHEKVWEKINGIIKDQGYVIVEPLFNKVFDFALQFEMKKGKVKLLGTSNFITDAKGQYQGNYLNGEQQNFNPQIIAITQIITENISRVIIDILENSDLAIYYEGNFGVDMLIYRDKHNHLKINPCLEINVRQSMGLLSLQLEKLIMPKKPGIYQTYYNPKKSFFEFATEMEKLHPLEISNLKIQSGFFPLIDYHETTQFGAYIFV